MLAQPTSQMLDHLQRSIEELLIEHSVGEHLPGQWDGAIASTRGNNTPDLFAMVDSVFILHIIDRLESLTTCISREKWAARILSLQGVDGWFDGHYFDGHSREHATAYAIAALSLLSIESTEDYINRLKPIPELLPLLEDRAAFTRWIERLGFAWGIEDILNKNMGWHIVWRGSHAGGGVAAIIHMAGHLFESWFTKQVDVSAWFERYFDWLNAHVNPMTGYWQRAFWNRVIRKPTIIDLGGAVHFHWIYQARRQPFPYPAQVVESTLSLQKHTGLYDRHPPYCIDFDGNYCLISCYLALSDQEQRHHQAAVYQSAERNFEAIIATLESTPLSEVYDDLHGLPGALAALVECSKLPGF
ncbi:MAG: hypothetical protein GYB68_13290, partial [Chloroflexi bacterium]|nr:hypothetical protein [Chloroflexota bacterium]